MTKEKVKKYLKQKELDIQRANAALLICDLVYSSYAEADKLIKTVYSPVFVYETDYSCGSQRNRPRNLWRYGEGGWWMLNEE